MAEEPDIVIVETGIEPMLIADPALRERVREITFALIGEGEPLP